MTPPCPMSKRVLPGYEWDSAQRIHCPQCDRRVMIVAGRIREHRLPSKVDA